MEASNESTAINYSTETSNTGQYNFQDLPLGSYTVTAAVIGFKSVSVKGVTVTAGNIYSPRSETDAGRGKFNDH